MKESHSTSILENEIGRKQASLGKFRGHSTDVPFGGSGKHFLCFIKTDVNILNAFRRPSHSLGREAGSCPSYPSSGREGNDSTWECSSLESPPTTDDRGKSFQLDPAIRPGLAHSFTWIPGHKALFLSTASPCQVGKGAVCPLFLQPGVLACFLSRNLRLALRSILPASICFLYLALAEKALR